MEELPLTLTPANKEEEKLWEAQELAGNMKAAERVSSWKKKAPDTLSPPERWEAAGERERERETGDTLEETEKLAQHHNIKYSGLGSS